MQSATAKAIDGHITDQIPVTMAICTMPTLAVADPAMGGPGAPPLSPHLPKLRAGHGGKSWIRH